MDAYYADEFVLPLPEGHRFPMAKYRLLRDRIAEELPLICCIATKNTCNHTIAA